MTYNFTVTFSRPDELDLHVYTSGHNAVALSVATAEKSVRRQLAHLTVRSVELSAVLTDDGDIIGGPAYDLGAASAARAAELTPAERLAVRASLAAQHDTLHELVLSTAWHDGFLSVLNAQIAADRKAAQAPLTVATIESLDGLTNDEKQVVRCVAAGKGPLDEVEGFLRVAFRSWFVYRGGNHVALHRVPGGPRVLLVVEARR